jgi:catechol 2,3-dioxygenase-like lactoylglutathione lyase family enzyme
MKLRGWRNIVFVLLACLSAATCWAGETARRPKIYGIAQVRILTTDTQKASAFYDGVLEALAKERTELRDCVMCEEVPSGGRRQIELDAIQGQVPRNLLSAVVLRTDDAPKLRDFLKKSRVEVGKLSKAATGTSFSVADPENHRLVFVQVDVVLATGMPGAYASSALAWPHIIHAGWVVKDREAMDKFYKDVLGFHVYWQGGMKEGETNWVDMQVPDGTDWIEYMLRVPAAAGKRTLGVMNHIALGVTDVRAAANQLEKAGVKLTEQPKIGRDGKWQLNLYDPDQTRVELMEFTPVEKPCCAEYTGPHPKP